jgi:hypothetical protein
MMRPEFFGIVFLLMGCSKPDCSPELFDKESRSLVPDVSEYLDDNGHQVKNCHDLCYQGGSELTDCEVTGRSEATEADLELLEKYQPFPDDCERSGGGGGEGGACSWPDPGIVEHRCTYDRSSSKPECDNED